MKKKPWRLHGRKRPYTDAGIKRLPCFRCGEPSRYQWTICSDGNLFRPICALCDVEMNRAVLNFMGFRDAARMISSYSKRALKP